MNEIEREEALSPLTLKLADGPLPFALQGAEIKYGPDDWAWLFLRLNENYQKAYGEVRKAGSPFDKASTYLDGIENEDIRYDSDGRCRKGYGLAAWLHPFKILLNDLSSLENNGSWFFHLQRPVSEDYRRTEVSDSLYIRPSGPPISKNITPPYLSSIETPFGYLSSRSSIRKIGYDEEQYQRTWVAIDCSIPVEGQMRALKKLVESNRKLLQTFHNYSVHEKNLAPEVHEIKNSEIFSHMRFLKSQGQTGEVNDSSLMWRAVCIDSLGSHLNQLTEAQKILKEVHWELVQKGWAKNSIIKRLPGEEMRFGGHYLKALHMIYELRKHNYEFNEIAEIVGVTSGNSRYVATWGQDFHSNMHVYFDAASHIVESEYKYLVHFQKPSPIS